MTVTNGTNSSSRVSRWPGGQPGDDGRRDEVARQLERVPAGDDLPVAAGLGDAPR